MAKPPPGPVSAPPAGQPAYLTGLPMVLGALCLALANFVVVLDITIANVSVPHIAGGLAVSPSQGTWVITSYAVAEAIVVPLTGWLAARFGTVRWLVVSLVGFGLFSFLCGAAQSIEMLIAFRVLQGMSGGPIMPLTQAMLTRMVAPEKVPMAMGLWATTTITAPIFGPILGGWISDNWSWPWIFFINLPVLALCVVAVLRLLPRFETDRARPPIDTVGLVLLIVWVGAFQLMLDTGREHDWFHSPFVVAMALLAVVGFAAFIVWEWYEPHPVVNIRLLRDRTLAVATLAVSLGFAAMFSSVVLIPLWLQNVMGYTATEAGMVMGYQGMLAVLAAPFAAMLMRKVDIRLTICLGIAWIAVTTIMRMQWNTQTDHWGLVFPILLQGIGMPFFFVGATSFSISAVSQQNVASAAGIVTFARTVAGAVATALATTLWFDHARVQRAELVPGMNNAEGAMATMQAGGMSQGQSMGVLEMLVETQALTNSAAWVYGLSVILTVAAASVIWLAPKPTRTISPGGGGH